MVFETLNLNFDNLPLGQLIKDNLTDIQEGGGYSKELVENYNKSNAVVRNFLRQRIEKTESKKQIKVGGGIIDLYFDDGKDKMTDRELLDKISKMDNDTIMKLVGGGILSFFSKKPNFDKFLADVDKTSKTVEKKIANFNITAKGAKFLAERKYKLLGEYFKIVKYKIILERAVKEPSIVKNEKKKSIYNSEITIMDIKKDSIEKKLKGVDKQFKKIYSRERGFFDKVFGKKKYNMSQKLQYVLKEDNKKILKLLKQEKALSEKIIDIESKKQYYIAVNKEGQDELFKQYKKLIKDYEKNKEQYEKILAFASSSKLNDIEKIKDMKNSLQLDFIEYERLFNELDSTKKKSDNLMNEYETFLENLFEKLFDLLDIIGKDDEGMIGFMSKMKKDIREIAIYIKTFTFNKAGIGGESNFNMLLSSYECLHLYAKSSVKYLRILRANLEAVKTAFLELVVPEKIYKQLFHMDVAFQTIRFNINQSLVIVNNISPLLRSLGITVGGGKLSKKALTLSGGADTDNDYSKYDIFNVACLTLSVPCLNAAGRIMNKDGSSKKIDEDGRLGDDATVWDALAPKYNITEGTNPLNNRITAEHTAVSGDTVNADTDGSDVDYTALQGYQLAISLFDEAKKQASTKATVFNKSKPTAVDKKKAEAIRNAAIDYLKQNNAYRQLIDCFKPGTEKKNTPVGKNGNTDMTNYKTNGNEYYDFICLQDTGPDITKNTAGILDGKNINFFGDKTGTNPNIFLEESQLNNYMNKLEIVTPNFRTNKLKSRLQTLYNKEKYEIVQIGSPAVTGATATGPVDSKLVDIDAGYGTQFSLFKLKDKIKTMGTNELKYKHVVVINVFDDITDNTRNDLKAIKVESEGGDTTLNDIFKTGNNNNKLDYDTTKIILTGRFNKNIINNKQLKLTIDNGNGDTEIKLIGHPINNYNNNLEINTKLQDINTKANAIYTNDDSAPQTNLLMPKVGDNYYKISNHLPLIATKDYGKIKTLENDIKKLVNKPSISQPDRTKLITDHKDTIINLLRNNIEYFKNKLKKPIYESKKDKAQEFYNNYEGKKITINSNTNDMDKLHALLGYLNEINKSNFINTKYSFYIKLFINILMYLSNEQKQTVLAGGYKKEKIDFTNLIKNKKLSGGANDVNYYRQVSDGIFNFLGGLFKAGLNQDDSAGTGKILKAPSATGTPGGTPGGTPVVSPGVLGGLVTASGLPAGMVSPYGSGSLTVNVPGYGMVSYAPVNNFASIDPEVLEKIKVVFIFDEYTKFKNTNLSPFISSMSVITQNMANIEKIEIIPIKDKKLPEISDNFAKKLGEIRQNNFEMKKVPSKKIEKANRDLQDVIAENDKISTLAMEILEVNSGNILSKMNDWMMDIAQGNNYRQPLDNIVKCCQWLQNNTNLEDFIKQLENKSMFKNNSYAKYLILSKLGQLCNRESLGGNYILRNKIDMYKNDPVVKDILDKGKKKPDVTKKKQTKSSTSSKSSK